MIHTFPEVASPYYKQRLLCCHYLKHPLVEPALRVYLGHGNFPMGACLRLNFGKLPAKSYNCFVACVQKTKQSKGTHNSFKVTHSEVLLSQKKKVCSLLRWTLVLEGYWIFLFPGKTAKFFTTSKVKKVPFYTWSLKAYLSLAAEWFADSIWTEHPQPRAAKAEQSFCRILSHQLLRVTCNTGRVSCRHSIWSLLPKKGSYLT